MNETKRAEIERLAIEHHQAKLRREALGLYNVHAEPEIAQRNAVAYALAQAEEHEAWARLQDATASRRSDYDAAAHAAAYPGF